MVDLGSRKLRQNNKKHLSQLHVPYSWISQDQTVQTSIQTKTADILDAYFASQIPKAISNLIPLKPLTLGAPQPSYSFPQPGSATRLGCAMLRHVLLSVLKIPVGLCAMTCPQRLNGEPKSLAQTFPWPKEWLAIARTPHGVVVIRFLPGPYPSFCKMIR